MKSQQGITLIEVLVSLLVIMGGLTALTKFQAQLSQSHSFSKQQTDAALIAESAMGTLKTLGKSHPWLVAGTDKNSGGTNMPNVTGNSAVYSINWAVYDKDSASPATLWNTANCSSGCNVKRILVTVSWTDSAGKANAVQLENLLPSL